jgi:uncharacterized protein
MERSIAPFILKDLQKKIVLVSGPRQVGKTTLAKNLMKEYDYFNFDNSEHRLALNERNWDRRKPLVIFDELHKMPEWKTFLKGIFDVEGTKPALLVTGSAKLDAFKKLGDSLAGRFFSYRLHPFDVKEASSLIEPEEALSRLFNVSGFPEPFLENDPVFYARWKKSHIDVILRQDLFDLSAIQDILSVETLIEMLRGRVGSPISYANLAQDLKKDPKTIKSYLELLESLYIIFPVRPWHRNIARSILKEPKYYFFDTAMVKGDDGKKLENAVACIFKKQLHFLEDTRGVSTELCYLRTKTGNELDFVVSQDGELTHAYEIKLSDSARSPSFSHFEATLAKARKIQIVMNCEREKTYPDGLEIRKAAAYLAAIDLSK